jgi:hypothetical protein
MIGRTQMAVKDGVITLGLPSVHGESPRHGVSAMLYVYVDCGSHRRKSQDLWIVW